jgi:hypothetical protein
MNADKILQKYENRIVSPGGEVYLNCHDSLNFIVQCESHKIPIYGIDIVKITPLETVSPLDKTIEYHDQYRVYECSTKFVKDQMDDEWNYAIFVVD